MLGAIAAAAEVLAFFGGSGPQLPDVSDLHQAAKVRSWRGVASRRSSGRKPFRARGGSGCLQALFPIPLQRLLIREKTCRMAYGSRIAARDHRLRPVLRRPARDFYFCARTNAPRFGQLSAWDFTLPSRSGTKMARNCDFRGTFFENSTRIREGRIVRCQPINRVAKSRCGYRVRGGGRPFEFLWDPEACITGSLALPKARAACI